MILFMIEDALDRYWPPQRVRVSCNECGVEMFDTKKDPPEIWKASYVATLIITYARKHENEVGHADIDIEIDEGPVPVQEIDATITVND